MSAWKFVDGGNRVVSRLNDDGKIESCVVDAISDWIAAGNVPLPADAPSAAEINAPVVEQIRALEIKWHRPFREGDTARAADIAAQIVSLRATLVK